LGYAYAWLRTVLVFKFDYSLNCNLKEMLESIIVMNTDSWDNENDENTFYKYNMYNCASVHIVISC